MLQRLIKDYAQTTSKRVLLLRHLIDACVPVLHVHMEIVVGGRGLDLNNNSVTHADRSRLHVFDDITRKHKVLGRMNTPGFHGYLRQLQSHLPEVMGVLEAPKLYLNMLKQSQKHHEQGTTASRYHDHSSKDREAHQQLEHMRQFIVKIETSTRRELLELYVKKKKQYMFQQRVVAPMKHTSIPVFGISDAKVFIREGVDPLSRHLLQEKQREDELFAEKEFSASHRKENMVRRGMMMASKTMTKRADQSSSSSNACFLLMQSLNELDILDCIVAFSLKALRARSIPTAPSRSSSSSSSDAAADAAIEDRSISVGSPLFSRRLVSAMSPPETLPDKPLYSSSIPSRPSVIPSSRRGTTFRGPPLPPPKSIVGLMSSSQLLQQQQSPNTSNTTSSSRSHHLSAVGRRHDSFMQPTAPATGNNVNSNFRGNNKTPRGAFTASSYVGGNW